MEHLRVYRALCQAHTSSVIQLGAALPDSNTHAARILALSHPLLLFSSKTAHRSGSQITQEVRLNVIGQFKP